MDHLCFLVRYGLKDCLKGGYHLLLTESQKERLLKVLPLTLLFEFQLQTRLLYLSYSLLSLYAPLVAPTMVALSLISIRFNIYPLLHRSYSPCSVDISQAFKLLRVQMVV